MLQRRFIFSLALIVGALTPVGAYAGTHLDQVLHSFGQTTLGGDPFLTSNIAIDGNLVGSDDWIDPAFTLPGSEDSTAAFWTPDRGAYAIEDVVDASGRIWPGYGGQNFDAEALYTGLNTTNDRLFVSLVTGFDIGGQSVGDVDYNIGDIFIDIGNDGTWDLAFDLTDVSGAATTVNSVTAFTTDDTPQGGGFDNIFDPLDVLPSPWNANGTDGSGDVEFAYTDGDAGGDDGGDTDHNVFEFGFDVTELQSEQMQSIDGWTVFWTMSCGNDFLFNSAAGTGTFDPPVVPTPSAFVLGSLGLLGVSAIQRRRAKNQK